jgi:hypothetical protein
MPLPLTPVNFNNAMEREVTIVLNLLTKKSFMNSIAQLNEVSELLSFLLFPTPCILSSPSPRSLTLRE